MALPTAGFSSIIHALNIVGHPSLRCTNKRWANQVNDSYDVQNKNVSDTFAPNLHSSNSQGMLMILIADKGYFRIKEIEEETDIDPHFAFHGSFSTVCFDI